MTEARATILVVEDEPEIRRFLRSSLGAEGYRVVEAETGARAAIDAGTHKPDLAIVDLGLPDLDGVEVIRRIRGWSPMPDGAIWLTEVGPTDDPKPADWLWQYPTDDGKGGHVFMHNGDNLIRYPDHGPHRFRLVRDICAGLAGLGRPPSPGAATVVTTMDAAK